ncbi:MAG: universal stress protein [Pseudomonadota bacterium]
MYKNIMVPVDLAHPDKLTKALGVAADLGKHYGAKITAVGVTGSAPTEVAASPDEFADALRAFTSAQSAVHGITFAAKSMVSPDPAIDLDDTLAKAARELDCDLVVMASHIPGFAEYIFASQAGYLAAHSDLSVFIVR